MRRIAGGHCLIIYGTMTAFFMSNLPRSQWFSAATPDEKAFSKVIEAFKKA